MNLDSLPPVEFGFPGPLRDRLVAAVLSGVKTTTSALLLGYERENEPLPRAGQRLAVVDSAGRRVAAIELTEVRVVRLADVDLRHALDEGEGDESVAQWRAGHERFWHSAEVRAELGDPNFTVNDDTLVLAQRFRLAHGAARMVGTDDIRRWAIALPEVEESSHARFHAPVFKVRGRTFLGMGKGETTAVFCVSEQEANDAAAADPANCEAVRRGDARRSFLGLQVGLSHVSEERIRGLVEAAWRQQAPKSLVGERDRGGSRSAP